LPVLDVLRTYRKRWGIESTFSALKSRGLNLESTHMTAADRISRLFGLLCIALAWMVRVGHDEQGTDLLTVDKRGRPARSRARMGWTHLSQAVRWAQDAFWAHLELLNIPFPAPDTQKFRSVSC
ncbi:transposase, partial [Deinococcus malanensis]|uniref:transposase n=1 Tax=Deinococcus malanensis TaxID=1706855 RepID=UPI00166A018A